MTKKSEKDAHLNIDADCIHISIHIKLERPCQETHASRPAEKVNRPTGRSTRRGRPVSF